MPSRNGRATTAQKRWTPAARSAPGAFAYREGAVRWSAPRFRRSFAPVLAERTHAMRATVRFEWGCGNCAAMARPFSLGALRRPDRGAKHRVRTPRRARELLPLWSVVPFALVLLAIAVMPLVAPHFWEHNRNKAILSAPWDSRWWRGSPSTTTWSCPHAARVRRVHPPPRRAVRHRGGVVLRGTLSGTPGLNTASSPSARCSRRSSGRRARRCCSSGRCCAPTRFAVGSRTWSCSSSSW